MRCRSRGVAARPRCGRGTRPRTGIELLATIGMKARAAVLVEIAEALEGESAFEYGRAASAHRKCRRSRPSSRTGRSRRPFRPRRVAGAVLALVMQQRKIGQARRDGRGLAQDLLGVLRRASSRSSTSSGESGAAFLEQRWPGWPGLAMSWREAQRAARSSSSSRGSRAQEARTRSCTNRHLQRAGMERGRSFRAAGHQQQRIRVLRTRWSCEFRVRTP